MVKTYVVTTPTGNIGRHVVRELLNAGKSIRIIARNLDKLEADVRSQDDLWGAFRFAAHTLHDQLGYGGFVDFPALASQAIDRPIQGRQPLIQGFHHR
jgi:nucleoside-diphosphate-sugar epimerase